MDALSDGDRFFSAEDCPCRSVRDPVLIDVSDADVFSRYSSSLLADERFLLLADACFLFSCASCCFSDRRIRSRQKICVFPEVSALLAGRP